MGRRALPPLGIDPPGDDRGDLPHRRGHEPVGVPERRARLLAGRPAAARTARRCTTRARARSPRSPTGTRRSSRRWSRRSARSSRPRRSAGAGPRSSSPASSGWPAAGRSSRSRWWPTSRSRRSSGSATSTSSWPCSSSSAIRRWPVLFAVGAAIKIAPGLGIVYLAARGRWRDAAIASRRRPGDPRRQRRAGARRLGRLRRHPPGPRAGRRVLVRADPVHRAGGRRPGPGDRGRAARGTDRGAVAGRGDRGRAADALVHGALDARGRSCR